MLFFIKLWVQFQPLHLLRMILLMLMKTCSQPSQSEVSSGLLDDCHFSYNSLSQFPFAFCLDWLLSSFIIFLGYLAYQAPGVSPRGVLECLHRELVYSLAYSFVNIVRGDEIFASPQPWQVLALTATYFVTISIWGKSPYFFFHTQPSLRCYPWKHVEPLFLLASS